MIIATLDLKHGPMVVEVEQIEGQFQRVARYTLSNHPNPKFNGKTLYNSSKKLYKTEKGATKEAKNFISIQPLI